MKFPHPLVLGAAVSLAAVQFAGAVDYKSDVLPIFQDKCFKCHGNGKDKGSVRLDLEHIKGEVGYTVKPGDPMKSAIYDSVTTEERDLSMPPPGKGSPLTTREKKIVHDWIESGASIGGEAVEVARGGGGALPAKPEGPASVTGQWENNKGQIITATALRVVGGSVIFKLPDGREVPYPISNLAAESQAKVRAFAESKMEAGGATLGRREEEKEDEDEREDREDDDEDDDDDDDD